MWEHYSSARFSIRGLRTGLVTMILFCLIGTGLTYAQQNPMDEMRTLTVTGSADVRLRPEVVQVRIGVETEAPVASDAVTGNAAKVARIVDALRSLGISDQSMQTSTYQINPVRRFDTTPPQVGEPPIVGYSVINIINVRSEKLDLAPRIIDQSIKAGANRVEDVRFTLRDENTVVESALRQAVANARRKAEVMAKEMGVTLVAIQRVQEGSSGIGPQPMFRLASGVNDSVSTPILPGEIVVDASLTLTYTIR